jgi:hypothetical protein
LNIIYESVKGIGISGKGIRERRLFLKNKNFHPQPPPGSKRTDLL